MVGQSLARRDHDRFTGVNSHRVHVLHVADRHTVVVGIPHDFVLDLFPAAQALLDEHLRRVGERRPRALLEGLRIRAHTGPQSAQGIRDTQHDRVADGFGSL